MFLNKILTGLIAIERCKGFRLQQSIRWNNHKAKKRLSTGESEWTDEDSDRVGVFETEFNPALATLPLVLLDIDGVLNKVYHKTPDKAWKDEKQIELRFPLKLSPTVINFFNDISRTGVAEIRWLTTWDAKAQSLAPKIGLDNFLLARDPAQHLDKSKAALELALRYPDRPICWLDDEVGYYVRSRKLEEFWEKRVPKTMLLQPRSHLTEEHLKLVDKFLRFPSENLQIDLTSEQTF